MRRVSVQDRGYRARAPVVRITLGDLAISQGDRLIPTEEVPDPPQDAKRFYGVPPYQNGGYVIDVGSQRWRFDRFGMMGYIVYGADKRPDRLWTRAGGY